ncbi:MAG: PhzF family phenazine biosynthesis isomerase [Alphaproteobacteria bacterium]|nr:PhzF family phenazine biosynthesis isomerase [Alphaproteobacteria bacterium]
MKSYSFEVWDVFTDRPFAGNPLAVILDAQGLSGDDMLRIAREFNLSESTFVLPPDNPAHAARVRIFTPGYEMPFAGHPTVGTALALARRRGISDSLTLELKAGLFPVMLDTASPAPRATFQNPNAPEERGAAPAAEAIEKALALPSGAVDRGAHRPRRIGAGVDYVFARAPLESVRRARLDHAAFAALGLDEIVGVLLYAEGGDSKDADFHVRMFAPGAGVSEDPATGSAAAALPGQIARAGGLADGAHQWIVEQGLELGRPSRIEVAFDMRAGRAEKVKIGGSAMRVTAGEIFI